MVDAYAISPPPLAAIEIAGSAQLFPVRRILCVGRNYAAHAREMGGDPDRTPPFFFAKPADAVVADGETIPYPPLTSDLHHEVELVVAIGHGGADIAARDALDCVFGYAVGIDLTRRDRQAEAKANGQPWEWGKAFDRSAPVGALRRASEIGHPAEGRIELSVNGTARQQGDLADMIWPVADIIAAASRSIALAPGDLLFTGTPAGVGPIHPGDTLVGTVANVGRIAITIEQKTSLAPSGE